MVLDALVQLLLFAISLTAVIKGADWFTDAAVWFAETYRIPKVIIGATIISLSTTLPELTVSTYSSYMGQPEVALGNVIGSAICNIGLIMGISLIIRSYKTNYDLFMHKGIFMAACALIMFALAADGMITRNDGLVLLVVLLGYVYYSLQVTKAHDVDIRIADEMRVEKLEYALRSIFNREYQIGFTVKFLMGAATVVIGGKIMVDSGVAIATMLGVSEAVIGLTLVAVGTSLPEMVTSITAALKGHLDLSIGNILGANILDITWVMGLSAFVRPVPVGLATIRIDLPVLTAMVLMVVVFGRSRKSLERWEGILLLIFYTAFITYRFFSGAV
jgi:cation:H+ antiporter